MNALYVTVSIPLLLVLAGFNHAHGLTTFGKSNQATQQPHPPPVQGKSCTSQANCTLIKGTTCLKGYCLCGDNSNPVNGGCKAQYKGPRHICNVDNDCVDGADCLPPKNVTKNGPPLPDKICICQEGLAEIPGGMCGGGSNFIVLPGLVLIITTLSRTLN